MKREHLRIMLGAVLSVAVLLLVIFVLSNTVLRKDRNGDEDNNEEIEPRFINITMKEIYLTDRTTTRSFDETLMTDWLVCWVDVRNEGEIDYNFTITPVELVTDIETHFSIVEAQYFTDIFPENDTIPPGGTIGGWLHFRIQKGEKPLKLVALDFDLGHFQGDRNISGEPLEFRVWKTPLKIEIGSCGRDGPADPHPGIFYMNISVSNTGKNASIFESWHLRLNVTGGNVRDVMFGEFTNQTFIFPGETKGYKLYFDIRKDHPEKPEVLVDVLNWIFLDVDGTLYSDYV